MTIRAAPTLVSILVPVFDEEETVQRCYEAVVDVFDALPDYDLEIVFTDNHSTDRTFTILSEIAAADPRVRVIRFSRNYGYQRSVLAGYKNASGACAIQLDCDLQDPPHLIPAMLEQWREGHQVVYGVRRSLQDGFATTLARRVFYRLISALSEDDLPLDAGEFRLVDSCILRELKAIDDTSPYLRGLISSMGFSQVGIPYDRDARTAGRSKFSLKPMIALAVDGLLNHSLLPLRIASAVGLFVGSVTFLLIFIYLLWRLVVGSAWPAGFATTTLLLLMSITLNALFLGIIGEYLGRIFMQAKRRPAPLVERTLNSPQPRPAVVAIGDAVRS
jgi:glycosyltransferase involved in cell wall biosynthesis